jgi:hypothetical protein
MAMQYINFIRSKPLFATVPKSNAPILNEEGKAFLNRITSGDNPPALPPRPEQLDVDDDGALPIKDAQVALTDGAQNIPLPDTPQAELTKEPSMIADKDAPVDALKRPTTTWTWLRRDSRDWKQETTASNLADIAQGLKDADTKPNEDNIVEDKEANREEKDMAIVLEKLNLAAVNNRVFSISDKTQEIF